MKHIILLIAMAVTCLLAAVANVIITRLTGVNVFTFKIWFVIPIGAMGVGMLGVSGAILAARYFNIIPTVLDAVVMVVAAAATMTIIYYLDYTTLVLSNGRRAADLVDFATYIDWMLTKTHMRVGRGASVDTGEVGAMGYPLAGVELLGFLFGGAATFFFIKDLWRCVGCGAYLRKLKTKQTNELTFDEAGKLIELFNAGDLGMVQGVMAWAPPKRAVDSKEQRASISFTLFGCPKCKAEVISANVRAFNGREWKDVPALTTRRDLSDGLSLRDQFA